jgi:hypothetical protein
MLTTYARAYEQLTSDRPIAAAWDGALEGMECQKAVNRYASGDATAEFEIRAILASDSHPKYGPMCELIALHHFGIVHSRSPGSVIDSVSLPVATAASE